jgi:GR25 family glycosyltransferase involved in LPS biosynthesis
MTAKTINSINDIKHILYINLDSRPDREAHIKKELLKIGFNGTRFNAIKMSNGAIGCSMSHLKCIQMAKENNWDHVCILEDDIEFLNPALFLNQLTDFFNSTIQWDVVLIAGNNMIPYKPVNHNCIQVFNCQTTTGYIIKKEFIPLLMENLAQASKLQETGVDKNISAIDQYWKRLQETHRFYYYEGIFGGQLPSWSNIENRWVDYNDRFRNQGLY